MSIINNFNKNKNKTVFFKDISKNLLLNQTKNPLHGYSNFFLNNKYIYNKNNINSKNVFLSMEFEDVINNIRKQRVKNKKELKDKELSRIREKLDLNSNTLVNNTENYSKGSLNAFLNKINDDFNINYLDTNETKKVFDNKITPVNPIIVPLPPPKTKKNIQCSIETIKDLLKLINDNPLDNTIDYNINMRSLHNVKPHLEKLDQMVGMNSLKNSVVDQILYYIQDLNAGEDFMHTVIYGPPGTGKTEIAKLMGYIFSSLGILKNGTFKKASRADLIAGYLGQTAMKTKQLIESCLGGVLFIDEAYSLGNNEKRDSFAKECIDTICETLSDYKSNIMVIIAGYKEELNDCFFAYNKGLNSRFPWRFETDDYSSKELKDIFTKKVGEMNWKLNLNISEEWFEDKMPYFKFYGRDMETLLAKTKIAHSRRVFCKKNNEKKIITLEDLNNGFKKFIENDEVKKRKETDMFTTPPNMYL